MKLFARPGSATSKINRKEKHRIKDGMKKEGIRQLGTVEEIAALEERELARDKIAEPYREAHSKPNQPVNPE